MSSQADQRSDGITWISSQSLIRLRRQARQLPLNKDKIYAKQGGAYLSSFKGRGMEFDESRIYQAGDDIRNMDWRVTARTGTAHTKIFQEERERPVLLWLNLGASMMFATRNRYKSVVASELATTLAWSANNQSDRVGGLIFSGSEHEEIKPRRGKNAVLTLIGRIAQNTAWQNPSMTGEEETTHAVARLRQVSTPGSLIIMLSDFRHMSEKAYAHLANVARHNDMILIRISDPFERQLPPAGIYRLTDGKIDIQIDTASNDTREDYAQKYVVEQEKLERFCRKHKMRLVNVSTTDDAIPALQASLGLSPNLMSNPSPGNRTNRRSGTASRYR
jgi:uncharacterized protein (DUF58 family)